MIITTEIAATEAINVIHQAFKRYETDPQPSSALNETAQTLEEELLTGTKLFGVVDQGDLLAVVKCILKPEAIYFARLSVLPEKQGKGFATKLIHHIEQYAVENGRYLSTCKVRKSEKDNIALYTKLGYTIVSDEVVPNSNGAAIPVVTMEKRLGINDLIQQNLLTKNSADEIINEIALNLYNNENYCLTERYTFDKLPVVIRDIILVLNLDTELNMQGVLGFLENSTGLFLDDTIETLQRIQAKEDYEILKAIKSILEQNNVSTQELRNNVDNQIEYSITTFSETHSSKYDDMVSEISKVADKLYLYDSDRDLFDYLLKYVDNNINNLTGELNKFRNQS